ncbi:MAG: Uma2 family endonuclease [Myxococcota bacterium]
MAGGSVEHAALAQAFGGLLVAHLRGGPCRAFSSDLRLRIPAAGVATYADASVVCEPVERDAVSNSHVTNPRVIVEVLSPSTEDYDRHEKRLYYQQIEALEAYVLVRQDRREVEIWRRQDRAFVATTHGPGDGVRLDSIDFTLVVDELYDIARVAMA